MYLGRCAPRTLLQLQRRAWSNAPAAPVVGDVTTYLIFPGVVKDVVSEIIKLAREHNAAVVVDTMEDESYRELKEGSGEKKHLLDGLGQLRRRLKESVQWYGPRI